MNNRDEDTNEVEVESLVAGDHPALVGHFPGEPLVPGVVMLECVAIAAERAFGARRLIAIPVVKFLAPLRPDERFRIALRRRDETGIVFECRRQTTVLARGRLIRAN
jgi:3-hydroxyacyl-[acyl-carrier-protein] dehydratase